MYINFQMLNIQTKLDMYPIPWVDNTLHKLMKISSFLKTDLSKAYHKVALEISYIYKTVFGLFLAEVFMQTWHSGLNY